jgi:hypothetical protein
MIYSFSIYLFSNGTFGKFKLELNWIDVKDGSKGIENQNHNPQGNAVNFASSQVVNNVPWVFFSVCTKNLERDNLFAHFIKLTKMRNLVY